MFTAKTEDGSFIRLYEKISDKEYLRKLRSSHHFFCPECSERVILKLGEKRVTHFAHEKNSICCASAEAESEYHLEGKLQLYNWLDKLGLQPVLEPYFSTIKQRADIGFRYNNKYYVIEYQCSPISSALLIKRTNGYRKENFHPIWIIGFKNMQKMIRNKLRVSSFCYQFLIAYNGQYILPTYCPSQKNFHFYHSLFPITINQLFASCHTQSINSMFFPPLWKSRSSPIPFQQWKKEIRKQKIHSIHYQTKNNDYFLKEIYINKWHPHFLPPYIGVPLRSNIHIETAPLFWQTYIFLDHFTGEKGNKIISLHKITEQFQRRMNRKEIKKRQLPMIAGETWRQAVYDYLHFLTAANILIEVKPLFYVLKERVIIEKNYETITKKEDIFYYENAAILNKLVSFTGLKPK
ncbi:MAG: competence protein CoiA family protein [Bacillus sp. (in: firmicutes)]